MQKVKNTYCWIKEFREFFESDSRKCMHVLNGDKLILEDTGPFWFRDPIFGIPEDAKVVKYKGKNVYAGELPKIIELFGEDKGRWGNFVEKAKNLFKKVKI